MKGIVLAGGSGTRLYPLTIASSKQMLPVYDKPMIFYPLATLMTAGIKDILIICTPQDIDKFKQLLGDGSNFGINLTYAIQPSPDGLAQAFIIGKKFINNDACAMILGDNIFYGDGIEKLLKKATIDAIEGKSTVFAYKVENPQRFGVVEFDVTGKAISIEEKPSKPKSDYCVTGLYFYNSTICEKAESITPSARGELEITDVNQLYLDEQNLNVQVLAEDYKWWDTGTFDSLMDAAKYVQEIVHNHNTTICSPEAVAFKNGWISEKKVLDQAEKYHKTSYGIYLRSLLKE